jgi:asparagine synthetase B (glutamine-hydrolysing)
LGSEPKAVLAHPQFGAQIDSEGLAELFSQVGTATPGHRVYRGLSQARPGTQVRVGRGGVRTCAYWALEAWEHTDDLATTARTAADGLLPADLLRRRKSIYPGAADQAYERAIDAQLHRLLAQPDAPLFDLISRERLTAAYSADPRLPGLMSVQPSSTSPVVYLLDVNRWLERSGVTIR